MGILQMFIQEVKKFSKTNWWVFIIYFILLIITYFVREEDLPQVILITSLHFVADIFMMMMFYSYSYADYRKGTYFQIVSFLIFLSIKIYTGYVSGHWVYIIADPIYLLAAVKNYQIDVRKKDIKLINFTSMTVLSSLIFLSALYTKFIDIVHIKESTFIKDLKAFTLVDWNLLVGLFLFAIALSTTGNEKRRYLLSVVALIIMIMGAFMKTIISFSEGKVHGLEISYAVLPLTVLVYNLRLWNEVMNKSNN